MLKYFFEIMNISPFFKQLFVAVAPLLAAFSAGGATCYPTVLLHQLKSNDSSIHLDFETSTWIGSIHGIAGLPSILVPTLMQWKGRKLTFICSCIIVTIGWLILLPAEDTSAKLLSESFHGLGTTSIFTISFLTISEMMSPRYRETFMQLYVICQVLAMAIDGLLTQYLHWKTIALIMGTPMILAMVIALMWPESPHWLAYKGHLKKCEDAFIWLRGTGLEAKKELNNLITKEKEQLKTNKLNQRMSIARIWNTFKSKDFYVPAFHMFILQCSVHWSGTTTIIIYSMELIGIATKNKNATFFSGLIVNAILMFGTILSISIRRYFNKKTVLLMSTFTMIICLLCGSVVFYMQSSGYLSKESLLSMFFIIAYVLCGSLGVMSLAYPVSTSLIPVKYRDIGGALFVINTCVLQSSSLKISPYLILYIDVWGTFLIYVANAAICGIILWKYIPDTERMTLQEIEEYYRGSVKMTELKEAVELEPMMNKYVIDLEAILED